LPDGTDRFSIIREFMLQFQGNHAFQTVVPEGKRVMLHCNTEANLSAICGRRLRKEIAMVAITYGVARVPAPKTVERAQAASPRQNIVGRIFTALMEARLQQAYREIDRRAYLFTKRGLRNGH
jgi:hypothetical protein